MDRQALIERIYDACEFPHCARSVYSNVYYALADAINMEDRTFMHFFPNLINPTQTHHKDDVYVSKTVHILENSRLDILESIANRLEYFDRLEY